MNDIPQNGIEALAEVRAGGETNLFDRNMVIELAQDYGWETAADWLMENKSRYMEALKAMGDYISKPHSRAELEEAYDDPYETTTWKGGKDGIQTRSTG